MILIVNVANVTRDSKPASRGRPPARQWPAGCLYGSTKEKRWRVPDKILGTSNWLWAQAAQSDRKILFTTALTLLLK